MIIDTEQPYADEILKAFAKGFADDGYTDETADDGAFLLLNAAKAEISPYACLHKIEEFLRHELPIEAMLSARSGCARYLDEGRRPSERLKVVHQAPGRRVSISLALHKAWAGCYYVVALERVTHDTGEAERPNLYDTVLDDRRRAAVQAVLDRPSGIDIDGDYTEGLFDKGLVKGHLEALEAAIAVAKSGGRVPSVIDALSELLGRHEELLTKIRIIRTNDGLEIQFEETPPLDDLGEAMEKFQDVTKDSGSYMVARAIRDAAVQLDNGAVEVASTYEGYEVIASLIGDENEDGERTHLVSVHFTEGR